MDDDRSPAPRTLPDGRPVIDLAALPPHLLGALADWLVWASARILAREAAEAAAGRDAATAAGEPATAVPPGHRAA